MYVTLNISQREKCLKNTVNVFPARKNLKFSLTFLLKFHCLAAQICDKLKLKCHIFQSPPFDIFLTSFRSFSKQAPCPSTLYTTSPSNKTFQCALTQGPRLLRDHWHRMHFALARACGVNPGSGVIYHYLGLSQVRNGFLLTHQSPPATWSFPHFLFQSLAIVG